MVKNNDAGGGMTVKEVVITSVKVAALVGVLYVLGYFLTVFTIEVAHSEILLRLFMEIIPIYPPYAPEDLNIEMMEGMSRTVLYLCAIFIPIALYRKIKKQ